MNLLCGAERGQAVRIGAVAYSPDAVTVFQGLTRYLSKNGLPADYVLYSSYDALVTALERGEVEIAWNTPLAHARYHVRNQCQSQTLVMRDVDVYVSRGIGSPRGSEIKSPEELAGRKLVLGSEQAAEATVLPLHFLKKEGVEFGKVGDCEPRCRSRQPGKPLPAPSMLAGASRRPRRCGSHHARPLEPRQGPAVWTRCLERSLDFAGLQSLRSLRPRRNSTKGWLAVSRN